MLTPDDSGHVTTDTADETQALDMDDDGGDGAQDSGGDNDAQDQGSSDDGSSAEPETDNSYQAPDYSDPASVESSGDDD